MPHSLGPHPDVTTVSAWVVSEGVAWKEIKEQSVGCVVYDFEMCGVAVIIAKAVIRCVCISDSDSGGAP